jgi:hypothetical protein
LKTECVRAAWPSSLAEARLAIDGFVRQYNTKRLHSSIGYVTPRDKLEGRAAAIHAQRDHKLAAAREARRRRRQAERMSCALQQARRMSYASELGSNQAGGAAPGSSRAEAKHSRRRHGSAPRNRLRKRCGVA